MKVSRLVMSLAILAGTVAGVAPVGTAAHADDCTNPIRLFFWYGRRVEAGNNPVTGRPIFVTATNPATLDSRYFGCNVGDGVIQKKPIYPGSTAVSGRADNSLCRDVYGEIHGLGLDSASIWKAPVDALGACSAVGTTGAASIILPIDPTMLGDIYGFTSDVGFNGRVIYSTIDH